MFSLATVAVARQPDTLAVLEGRRTRSMTMNPAADRKLGALVEAADRAMQAGRLEEAARGWESVLSLAPDHPLALMHLGQHALYRGQPTGATASAKGGPGRSGQSRRAAESVFCFSRP